MGNIADYGPLMGFMGILCGMLGILGWIFTTWLRVRHGYPLDGFGKALYPQRSEEMVERVKLISGENAQLRAELGAVKDRLATVERIVTDRGSQLDREIEMLRDHPVN